MNNKDKIEKIIKDAPDMIYALEAVGAMYGIPSSNVLANDEAKAIKVVEDCIIAPPVENTCGNIKPIICAIATCLDNISQKMNMNIDKFHNDNIKCGLQKDCDYIDNIINPPKGEIVSTHVADDGNEIKVYSSGLVEHPRTPETYKMFYDLQGKGIIPSYQPPVAKQTFFTEEEDDISAGLDIETPTEAAPIEDNGMSDSIGESAELMELLEEHDFTNHLGYEIFKEEFDYVKPTNSHLIQESTKSDIMNPNTIKHMKFDNKNIIKAIKCFNEARAEQVGAKKQEFDKKKLIDSPKWNEGVKALENQFNCHLNVRLFDDRFPSNLYTQIYEDIKQKLTLSKTKGFQLNGLAIDIMIFEKALDEDSPKSISLFGQNVVSTFLHEIFHNISAALRYEESNFEAALQTMMLAASSKKSGRASRAIVTRFVKTLDSFYGIKLNPIKRRGLIKQLTLIASMQFDDKKLDNLKKKIKAKKEESEKLKNVEGSTESQDVIDKEIEDLINTYQEMIDEYHKKVKSKVPGFLAAIGMCASFILLLLKDKVAKTLGAIWCIICLTTIADINGLKEMEKERLTRKKTKEEYYCDLFAGMYGLPVTFFLGFDASGNRRILPSQIKSDQLDRLAKLEKELYSINWSIYPTLNERNHAAVTIAKSTLANGGKIDPSIKEYLEWIVENLGRTHETSIGDDFNDRTFDPKEAEDLDKHITTIINGGKDNITITESFIQSITEDLFMN